MNNITDSELDMLETTSALEGPHAIGGEGVH